MGPTQSRRRKGENIVTYHRRSDSGRSLACPPTRNAKGGQTWMEHHPELVQAGEKADMPMARSRSLAQGLEDLFRLPFGHSANHGMLSVRSPFSSGDMAARAQYNAAPRLHAKDNLKKARLTITPIPRIANED